MRLLLDQNISFRLLSLIQDAFPESAQVKRLGLEGSTDLEIWEFAKKNGFAILTFDSDFFDISQFRGHPPKIIWLRTRNNTTSNLARILKKKEQIIKDFLEKEEYREAACLEID
jgi:predicted nuclease of predicted toxin-antitoxin system